MTARSRGPARRLRAQRRAGAAVLVVLALVAAVFLSMSGQAACCPPALTFPALSPCLDQAHGPLTIAVGAHANRPRPDLPPEIQVLVARAAYYSQPVSIVNLDGQPTQIGAARFMTPAGNDLRWQHDYRDFLTRLGASIAQVRAQQPENDPLAALSLMARISAGGGTIVMIDSGIQTLAPLDFRQPRLWSADPAAVADALGDNRELPDLTGRSVVMASLGDSAPPQPALSAAAYQDLLAIWKAIVARTNPVCSEFITRPAVAVPLAGVPPVSVVHVPAPIPVPLACATDPAAACPVTP